MVRLSFVNGYEIIKSPGGIVDYAGGNKIVVIYFNLVTRDG
jgi:hypothetical protein